MKLGVSCNNPSECTLVLEEDGTMIDEAEMNIKTFIILAPNEQWTPSLPLAALPSPVQGSQ